MDKGISEVKVEYTNKGNVKIVLSEAQACHLMEILHPQTDREYRYFHARDLQMTSLDLFDALNDMELDFCEAI